MVLFWQGWWLVAEGWWLRSRPNQVTWKQDSCSPQWSVWEMSERWVRVDIVLFVVSRRRGGGRAARWGYDVSQARLKWLGLRRDCTHYSSTTHTRFSSKQVRIAQNYLNTRLLLKAENSYKHNVCIIWTSPDSIKYRENVSCRVSVFNYVLSYNASGQSYRQDILCAHGSEGALSSSDSVYFYHRHLCSTCTSHSSSAHAAGIRDSQLEFMSFMKWFFMIVLSKVMDIWSDNDWQHTIRKKRLV